MRTPVCWSVAIGTTFALSLGGLTPAAAADPETAPAASPAATAGVTLPPDWASRLAAAEARTGVERSPATEAVQRAIDPDDYACSATQIDAYVDSLVAGLTREELVFLVTSGVLEFPTYDALLFGTSGDPDYALLGDRRQQLSGAFRDSQRFWDIDSSDIQLMAMHGNVLRDPARLSRLLVVLYDVDRARADAYADLVVTTVARMPGLKGGEHPLFTLNAFAFSGEGYSDPLIASIPDKIVLGDGILDFLRYAGLVDVGPRAVLAHEFAHHVQFERDLFASPLEGAEATRRTELMADAMATYYATHSRGLALNAKRVLSTQQAFYEVGDCQFSSDGHHGTPLQRDRASQWGAALADSARKQGHVMPSMTVAALFDAALPMLVAPDAT